MDRRSLYDDDIYAWTQQQAEALRRLAETRRDLPNELDLENVAEERRIDLCKDLTASMRAKIDLDAAWEVAVTKAEIDLAAAGDQVIPGLPGRSPFAVDDLASDRFDFDEAVERVRAAASRGDSLPR